MRRVSVSLNHQIRIASYSGSGLVAKRHIAINVLMAKNTILRTVVRLRGLYLL